MVYVVLAAVVEELKLPEGVYSAMRAWVPTVSVEAAIVTTTLPVAAFTDAVPTALPSTLTVIDPVGTVAV